MTKSFSIWKNPIYIIAFGFGAGLSKKAPGTFGTLVGVLLYWPLSHVSLEWYLFITALCFLLGIWICGDTAEAVGVPDYPGIVWDEIVGFFITMIGLPSTGLWVLLGFIVFRFFDILKPPPIRQLDAHLKGGLGVMVDDLVAGVFSCVLLHLIRYGLIFLNRA